MAHPLCAGVESHHQADEANGPELTECGIDQIVDLLPRGWFGAAQGVCYGIGDVVQQAGLKHGEHQASDRKGHHQDRHDCEHRKIGGRRRKL